jgi:hypothetical protein
MLAVINLTKFVASPQAEEVKLFNTSEEADTLLSEYTQKCALDRLLHVDIPAFSSAGNTDKILLTIASAVAMELDKYKVLPGRFIRCVFRVHNDCTLKLEVWHNQR